MLIKKVKNTIAVVAKVAQSLTNNSETDVPSVKAVKDAITTIKNDVLNTVYPIGAICLSMNSTNPSSLFGGTWEQIASGRILVGVDTSDDDFNTPGKVGGNKTNTLKLENLPSKVKMDIGLRGDRDVGAIYNSALYKNSQVSQTFYMDIGGKNQSFSIMPPYFTCYIWKRTA